MTSKMSWTLFSSSHTSYFSVPLLTLAALIQFSVGLECGHQRMNIFGACVCMPHSEHPLCKDTTFEGYSNRLQRAMSRQKCHQHGYPRTSELSANSVASNNAPKTDENVKYLRTSQKSDDSKDSIEAQHSESIDSKGSEEEKLICDCDSGWEGSSCRFPICINGASRNGTICLCPKGFTGTRCELVDCGHGTWNPAGFCICEQHWNGKHCENPTCENGGEKEALPEGGFKCSCPEWYIGERCETFACKHGSIQNDSCVCHMGFEGEYCDKTSCDHGYRRTPEDYFCTCYGKWLGFYCEECPAWRDPSGEHCCERGKIGKECDQIYQTDVRAHEMSPIFSARNKATRNSDDTMSESENVKPVKDGPDREGVDPTSCKHGYQRNPGDYTCTCYGKWQGLYCEKCPAWQDPSGKHCCEKGKIGVECEQNYQPGLYAYEIPPIFSARNQETQNSDDAMSETPNVEPVKDDPEWEGVWTSKAGAWTLDSKNMWILICVVIVVSLVIMTFLFIKFDKWRSKRSTARGYGVYMSQSSHLVQSIDEPYWDPRVNPIARVMSLPASAAKKPHPSYYQSSHSHPMDGSSSYRCAVHGQVPARTYI